MKKRRIVLYVVAVVFLLIIVIPIRGYYEFHRSAGELKSALTKTGQQLVSEGADRNLAHSRFRKMGLDVTETETRWGENSIVAQGSPKMWIKIPADPRVGIVVDFQDGRAISFKVYAVRFFF